MQGEHEVYKMEIDAEAGLNHRVWAFQRIIRERSESELEGMANRLRRFGWSEEAIARQMVTSKYITGPVNDGTYRIVLEMNGQIMTEEAMVLKDHWTNQ